MIPASLITHATLNGVAKAYLNVELPTDPDTGVLWDALHVYGCDLSDDLKLENARPADWDDTQLADMVDLFGSLDGVRKLDLFSGVLSSRNVGNIERLLTLVKSEVLSLCKAVFEDPALASLLKSYRRERIGVQRCNLEEWTKKYGNVTRAEFIQGILENPDFEDELKRLGVSNNDAASQAIVEGKDLAPWIVFYVDRNDYRTQFILEVPASIFERALWRSRILSIMSNCNVLPPTSCDYDEDLELDDDLSLS